MREFGYMLEIKRKTVRITASAVGLALLLSSVGFLLYEHYSGEEPCYAWGYRILSENTSLLDDLILVQNNHGFLENPVFYYGYSFGVVAATGYWGDQKDNWQDAFSYVKSVAECRRKDLQDAKLYPLTRPPRELLEYQPSDTPSEYIVDLMNAYFYAISDEVRFANFKRPLWEIAR